MTGRNILPIAALLMATVVAGAGAGTDSAITRYGHRNSQAPRELLEFSFLIGKWQGSGNTRLANGSYAQFSGVTWIGRYVLNGMAIADELHALTPDGKPYLGISLRQFVAPRQAWVIEYMNVTNSFLRRQVNPDSGSVTRHGNTIIVISDDGQTKYRESYRVSDKDHYTYRADSSADGGRNWDPTSIEMTMVRVE